MEANRVFRSYRNAVLTGSLMVCKLDNSERVQEPLRQVAVQIGSLVCRQHNPRIKGYTLTSKQVLIQQQSVSEADNLQKSEKLQSTCIETM